MLTEPCLTAEEFAAKYRKHVVTVRKNAKKWGGYKLPGSREWLFPASIPAGLTPRADTEEECRTSAKAVDSSKSLLKEYADLVGQPTPPPRS